MILLDEKEMRRIEPGWVDYEKDSEGELDLSKPIFHSGSVRTVDRAMVKATAKKILIQLQAIYNIPDLGAEYKRMGEFIQELMEEVNG